MGVSARFEPYIAVPLSGDEREAFVRGLACGWREQAEQYGSSRPTEVVPGWLSKGDLDLAAHLAAEAETDDVEDAEEGEDEDEVPKDNEPSLAEVWAAKATWVDEGWRGAGGMARAFHSALRRQAALVITQRALAQGAGLPEGSVTVDLTYGPRGTADLVSPLGNTGRLQCTVTFPKGHGDY